MQISRELPLCHVFRVLQLLKMTSRYKNKILANETAELFVIVPPKTVHMHRNRQCLQR